MVDLPGDFNLISILISMIAFLFWFSAAAGIIYDFVRYISRATGLDPIWRHLFESIVLLLSAIYAWNWIDEPGTLDPVYGLAGHIIILSSLIALVYSSYRKSIKAIWIDVVINCFLLAGIIFTIFYAVCSNSFDLIVFLGLPVNLLFIQTLLVNYNQLRTRHPRQIAATITSTTTPAMSSVNTPATRS
jgi:hypothetical protein